VQVRRAPCTLASALQLFCCYASRHSVGRHHRVPPLQHRKSGSAAPACSMALAPSPASTKRYVCIFAVSGHLDCVAWDTRREPSSVAPSTGGTLNETPARCSLLRRGLARRGDVLARRRGVPTARHTFRQRAVLTLFSRSHRCENALTTGVAENN